MPRVASALFTLARADSALNAPSRSQVPEYAGLEKPKHHMATHVVRDIELNGPPRAWWCMGFEAFNQFIKNMFKRSNYKSSTLSVANFALREQVV